MLFIILFNVIKYSIFAVLQCLDLSCALVHRLLKRIIASTWTTVKASAIYLTCSSRLWLRVNISMPLNIY